MKPEAWYNEPDPFKAAVLREAIKAGAIAPGVVDERSIKDVRASELVRFTQCHFFAGGVSGQSPFAEPDGQTTGPSGQGVAPAPASRQQAKAAGLMTLATSGRIGRNSSASAALQSSLESRLMTALDTAGSTLFKLTWKRRRTPLGRSYLERQVSVARTSGSGFTSWPTPQLQDTSGGGQAKRALPEERHGINLNDFAMLASWATPRNEDAESAGMRHSRGVADTLTAQTSLASWATPNARDWKSASASPEFLTAQAAETRGHNLSVEATLAGWATPTCPAPHDSEQTVGRARERDGYGQDLPIQAALTNWRTPSASDAERGVHPNPDTKAGQHSLNTEVTLAGWPTPCAQEDGKTPEAHLAMKKRMGERDGTGSNRIAITSLAVMAQTCGPARLTARGEMLTGSSAGMESGGQLRAGHSRWLMAIPAAWDGFAFTAMQSTSKSRRASSKRISKPGAEA